MPSFMQHWNGDLMVAIDVETTGLDPNVHEIFEIAAIVVTSNLQPDKQIMPFHIKIKPERLDCIEKGAIKINKESMRDAIDNGFDSVTASDLLCEWYERIDIPLTKYGTKKKMIPLGQNYCFDRSFLIRWLGASLYDDLFDGRYRDTMTTALFLNDNAGANAEKVPFSKVNLGWLAKTLSIENPKAHTALFDCLTTIEVYRKQVFWSQAMPILPKSR